MRFHNQGNINSEDLVMWRDETLALRPFAEVGKSTSTVGYRDVSSGTVVVSIELPVELIERSIMESVSVEISLSSTGEICSIASGTTSDCSPSKSTISLDELVDALLRRNNLHMEEAKEGELKLLLERLQKSVWAVERAIATIEPAAT
ncbi:hypothetical protein XH89_15750 [Bradyrhizobium sp. CCBAU 53340]|uniref:hypothetical protein n=1 Tax=Bradyrhizobium sp. CCBAU 53340 TaxID=1325112 RepID=UPI001889F877|nr:hypothetical protein [Bradyrhizobium sp. CCBAU 53340]QOZ44766.1 hypothetical protein XH89_15750 [Bradyrhizobium sp. CCBAU 53340]